MSNNRAVFEDNNERFEEMKGHFKEILKLIGEDPEREGLLDTPKRISKAWLEMTRGLECEPGRHLARQFTTDSSSMVLVKDIHFDSMCEHHFLSFSGTAHIAYVPGHVEGEESYRIAGLSKFARVVEEFAARPQVQENLTYQIANCIEENLQPAGCMVVLEASHSCMGLRGVRSSGSKTVTSSVTGLFYDNVDGIKDEALQLILR